MCPASLLFTCRLIYLPVYALPFCLVWRGPAEASFPILLAIMYNGKSVSGTWTLRGMYETLVVVISPPKVTYFVAIRVLQSRVLDTLQSGTTEHRMWMGLLTCVPGGFPF